MNVTGVRMCFETDTRGMFVWWGRGDHHHEGVDVRAISAGGSHTALVGSDGIVYTCGLNEHGQLGHSPDAVYVPVAAPVQGLPPHDPVVSVSAGHYHTLCVTEVGCGGKSEVVILTRRA